ncbi:MAG: PP2C family protein-serine/threonine phosphatase [Spirochaetota bacterium]
MTKQNEPSREEDKIAQKARDILEKQQHSPLFAEYQELAEAYFKLLRQSQKIIRLSDAQQNRLHKLNHQQELLTEMSNLAYKELNQVYSEVKQDLLFAREIQQAILPKETSQIQNKPFYSHYSPMTDIGGDFYDIVEIDGKIRVFFADATGHGIRAALISMLIKAEYESIKKTYQEPHEVLMQFNDDFIKLYESLNVFFTGIILDIDFSQNQVHYSSAGHPPQYLIKPQEIIQLKPSGEPLGFMEHTNYTSHTLELGDKDKFILFSDGIYEQFNQKDEMFGLEKLYDFIYANREKSCKEIIELLLQTLEEYRNGQTVFDDVTILGLG